MFLDCVAKVHNRESENRFIYDLTQNKNEFEEQDYILDENGQWIMFYQFQNDDEDEFDYKQAVEDETDFKKI